MTAFDNSYSRFIAWAKIILPLLALAVLSTLFLFSRGIDPDLSLPYAHLDVEELTHEPRVTAPNYSGVTDSGAALSVFAETARPNPQDPDRLDATMLRAAIDTRGGMRIDIESDAGVMDGSTRELTLSGGVTIKTSTGYEIITNDLRANIEGSLLMADENVRATGPFGQLDAGQMALELADVESDTYLLVFKGGVKLVYTPHN